MRVAVIRGADGGKILPEPEKNSTGLYRNSTGCPGGKTHL